MLLREGMDPTVAIANLTDLIGRLEGAGSAFARPGDWQAAQNGYLQAVETVERQLASLFEDDEGTAAGVFGGQYRMIREMSASTPRPEPLIGLEAGRQAAALQRLVSGVTALRAPGPQRSPVGARHQRADALSPARPGPVGGGHRL